MNMNIMWQVVFIIISVAILLDSINLLTNTSKVLVKFSIKIQSFCNANIREAIAKNRYKTSKILGIKGIIDGTVLTILSINFNNPKFNLGSTRLFILLGVLVVFDIIILRNMERE